MARLQVELLDKNMLRNDIAELWVLLSCGAEIKEINR